MKNRQTIESYMKGDLRLPATFSTGFKRDLDVAREIIRARRGVGPETPAADQPRSDPTEALELEYS